MRPIRRGDSPIEGNFDKYEDAKPELVNRLGMYCSYCERPIKTLLAVEHIQPKEGQYGRPELEKVWVNFLLACVNCNSTKGHKQVAPECLLLPDRDNTFIAFEYKEDGHIGINSQLDIAIQQCAVKLLELTGLDKSMNKFYASNGNLVYLDRVGQRMEAIGTAKVSLDLLLTDLNCNALKSSIISTARATGFFSIWMQVFENYPDMKNRFVETFEGTAQSGCFNLDSGSSISPSPNLDALPSGGKV